MDTWSRRNILLEYRYAEGNNDRLPQLAAELVRDKVDVIVTTASVSALAARRVTKTIPIVMTSGSPSQQGRADSLEPGGDVTGLTVLPSDLSGKRVELLKDTFPEARRVATLWSSHDMLSTGNFKETQDAAKAFAMQLYPMSCVTSKISTMPLRRRLKTPSMRFSSLSVRL